MAETHPPAGLAQSEMTLEEVVRQEHFSVLSVNREAQLLWYRGKIKEFVTKLRAKTLRVSPSYRQIVRDLFDREKSLIMVQAFESQLNDEDRTQIINDVLSVTGLTAQEAERLVQELDRTSTGGGESQLGEGDTFKLRSK